MPTPDNIKIDNGKSFMSMAFRELLDEMERRSSGSLTLTRNHGGAVALLTTSPRMIRAIKGYQDQIDAALLEGDGHVEG